MYVRLRAARSIPTVCLLCAFLSLPRVSTSTGARNHATQAALALQSPGTAAQSESAATSKSSGSGKQRRPKLDAATRAERGRRKAAEHDAKSVRQALKEAQEAERRRKALATLDKTTKFVAAGLEATHEPTLADLDELKPPGPPLITLEFVYPEPSSGLPRRSPKPSTVESHSIAFQKLIDTISTKFHRKQLLRLYKEGIQRGTGTLTGKPRSLGSLKKSRDVAGEIIRWLWHWPYVKEVEERNTYLTTRCEREFLISTSEFFLLLGPDGSSLRAITESHGVVVKRVRRTNNVFTLVVEGLSYMLDQLVLVLAERKKRIISEAVRLESSKETSSISSSLTEGSSIRPDLIQRISKLTNALVEDLGNDMFRISAHHTRNIIMAKRLAARTSQQNKLPPPTLLAHLPTLKDSTPGLMFPHAYALFPFELSNAECLPFYWTPTNMSTRSSEFATAGPQDEVTSSSAVPHSPSVIPYLYRARKVSDWLEHRSIDTVSHPGGLSEGVGRLINSMGQPDTLRKALSLPDFESPEVHGFRDKTITASLGHIVFAPAASSSKTLLPPLRGSWIFPRLLDWMKVDTGRMSFILEPPKPLINSSPLSQTILSRLVYRSTASVTPASNEQARPIVFQLAPITLKFEVSLSQSAPGGKDLPTSLEDTLPRWFDEDTFNSTVQSMAKNKGAITQQESLSNELLTADMQPWDIDPSSLAGPPSPDRSTPMTRNPPRLWKGVETFVNVMLPDRPMDLQLCSFEAKPIPLDSEPPELRDYALSLTRRSNHSDPSSRPIPPLHVTCEGTRYILDSNATVQLSSHVVTDETVTEQVDVTIENTVDFESNEHSDTCVVTCSEPNALIAWHKFLGDCDRLTWLRADKRTTHSVAYAEQGSSKADNILDSDGHLY